MHGWTSDTVDNKHSDAAIHSKKIVPAKVTRPEGHEMLHLYDGTPPEGFP
jgi:hypothetical protein